MLSLKIALRYLFSKKTHNAVNIISAISICGVMVATAALVCVLSVFNGFRAEIMSRLAQLDPPIAIVPASGKAISDADSLCRVATAFAEVDRTVPVIEDQALAVFAGFSMPVRVKGVPDDYNRLCGIDSLMLVGGWEMTDSVATYAVPAVGPAIELHLHPENILPVAIYAPRRQGTVNLANPMNAFRSDSLFVAGVFQLQNNAYDDDMIFIPIAHARRMFDYPDQATSVELYLKVGADADALLSRLQDAVGEQFIVKNRLMQQSESYRMVNVEKWMSFLLLAFILIIATFNIISTLSLLIVEKDESITTLRNLGATDRQISRIFVTQSWLVTLVGALAGIVLGVALCLGQQHFGWLKLHGDPSSLVIPAYPVALQWGDLVIVFALALGIAAVTGVITAAIIRHRLTSVSV